MTAHNKNHKKEKMVTFLVTKPFFDKMKEVTEKDDDLDNMSDLIRKGTMKEMRRRLDE